ncbi:WG repeat-containing protein [Cohnella massiliensis]|uniref:WG repeat-containing protein n=1 Tax=Cohnella massiliensis TaxID=1816691 RepID=UPI001594D90B|nr:WG repeat-containing protein [Cohnella massiliensis]
MLKTEDRFGNVGILNQAGNFIVPFSRGYQLISRFHDGRALVRAANLPTAYGFIDRQGNEVIPLQYASAGYFRNGLAAVQNFDGKWGFIDSTGKQLTLFKYGEEITDLKTSGYVMIRSQRLYGSGCSESIRLIPAKSFMRM